MRTRISGLIVRSCANGPLTCVKDDKRKSERCVSKKQRTTSIHLSSVSFIILIEDAAV